MRDLKCGNNQSIHPSDHLSFNCSQEIPQPAAACPCCVGLWYLSKSYWQIHFFFQWNPSATLWLGFVFFFKGGGAGGLSSPGDAPHAVSDREALWEHVSPLIFFLLFFFFRKLIFKVRDLMSMNATELYIDLTWAHTLEWESKWRLSRLITYSWIQRNWAGFCAAWESGMFRNARVNRTRFQCLKVYRKAVYWHKISLYLKHSLQLQIVPERQEEKKTASALGIFLASMRITHTAQVLHKI